MINDLATYMAARYPGTVTTYLDGDFPFSIGLPLLPHLSHNDGRKLDLALFYVERTSGNPKPRAGAWPIGYWAFAPVWPHPDRPPTCPVDGPMLWDMTPIQGLFQHLALDTARTADLLTFLASPNGSVTIGRIFVEPYLAERLGVGSAKIRFAGCHAARHDDHIHFEVR